MTAEELQAWAPRVIAERRYKKATQLAFLAHSANIPASALAEAAEHDWAQLAEAVRANTGINYGTPSAETRAMVLILMREYERRKGFAA